MAPHSAHTANTNTHRSNPYICKILLSLLEPSTALSECEGKCGHDATRSDKANPRDLPLWWRLDRVWLSSTSLTRASSARPVPRHNNKTRGNTRYIMYVACLNISIDCAGHESLRCWPSPDHGLIMACLQGSYDLFPSWAHTNQQRRS